MFKGYYMLLTREHMEAVSLLKNTIASPATTINFITLISKLYSLKIVLKSRGIMSVIRGMELMGL